MLFTAASGSVASDRFEPVSDFISGAKSSRLKPLSVLRYELAPVSRLEITVGSVRMLRFLRS